MVDHAPSDRDDVIYDRCFSKAQEGYFVYGGLPAAQLRPGLCGYWNVRGDWDPVCDLSDAKELAKYGYGPIDGIDIHYAKVRTEWPIRFSDDIQGREVGGLGSEKLRGVPAGVGVAYGYRSSNGEGAILTTKGLVKHNVASATTVQVMSTWFRQNYAKLLEQNPRAKRRGLWVITSTYTVPRCRIALLKSKDAEVHLSAEASVSDALNAKVAASWWHHQAGGLWKNHAADKGIVVACDGIYGREVWHSPVTGSVKFTETGIKRPRRLDGEEGNEVLPAFHFQLPDETKFVEVIPELKGRVSGLKNFDSDGEDQDGERDEDQDEDRDDDEGERQGPC